MVRLDKKAEWSLVLPLSDSDQRRHSTLRICALHRNTGATAGTDSRAQLPGPSEDALYLGAYCSACRD